ncbi:MAG: hypothetical protein KKG60_03050 [Nanoarchaeota archaeon]|nr:hypothetical protein [Nanoarchaeota archaeon]
MAKHKPITLDNTWRYCTAQVIYSLKNSKGKTLGELWSPLNAERYANSILEEYAATGESIAAKGVPTELVEMLSHHSAARWRDGQYSKKLKDLLFETNIKENPFLSKHITTLAVAYAMMKIDSSSPLFGSINKFEMMFNESFRNSFEDLEKMAEGKKKNIYDNLT